MIPRPGGGSFYGGEELAMNLAGYCEIHFKPDFRKVCDKDRLSEINQKIIKKSFDRCV